MLLVPLAIFAPVAAADLLADLVLANPLLTTVLIFAALIGSLFFISYLLRKLKESN